MRILPIVLLLLSAPAQAGISYIDLSIGSIHTKDTVKDDDGKEYNINGFNYGIGLTYEQDDPGAPDLRIGVVHNSYEDTSFYAAVNPHTAFEGRHWAVGVLLGLVTGYKDSPIDSDVIAVVAPQLVFLHSGYRAELLFLYGQYASAIGLNVGIGF